MTDLQRKLKDIPRGIESYYFNNKGKQLKKPWSTLNKEKQITIVSPNWVNESQREYEIEGTFNNFYQYALS